METIQIQNATSTKIYNIVRHTGVGPFIKMSNGYLPLTLETTTGNLQLKVVRGGKTYRPVEFVQSNISYKEDYKYINSYSNTSYTGMGTAFRGVTISGELTSISSSVKTYGATNATDYHATGITYSMDNATSSWTYSTLVTSSNSNGQTGTYTNMTTESSESASSSWFHISLLTNQAYESATFSHSVYSSGTDSVPYQTNDHTWSHNEVTSYSVERSQTNKYIKSYETRKTHYEWIKTDGTTSSSEEAYYTTVDNTTMIKTWL